LLQCLNVNRVLRVTSWNQTGRRAVSNIHAWYLFRTIKISIEKNWFNYLRYKLLKYMYKKVIHFFRWSYYFYSIKICFRVVYRKDKKYKYIKNSKHNILSNIILCYLKLKKCVIIIYNILCKKLRTKINVYKISQWNKCLPQKTSYL